MPAELKFRCKIEAASAVASRTSTCIFPFAITERPLPIKLKDLKIVQTAEIGAGKKARRSPQKPSLLASARTKFMSASAWRCSSEPLEVGKLLRSRL